MANIYLIDDHPLLVNAVKSLINVHPNYKVVGTCNHFTEAIITDIKNTNTDILLLDISMPKRDSFELVPIIKSALPDLKIVIFTMHSITRYFKHFLNLGVDGYLVKSGNLDYIFDAFKNVMEGNKYFPENILKNIEKSDAEMEENQLQFTDFEIKLISELKENHNNNIIATRLDCSLEKVLTTRKNLLIKTGVSNTNDLLNSIF